MAGAAMRVAGAGFAVLLCACGGYFEPYIHYYAQSDSSRMDEVAAVLEETWAEQGLVRHDHSRPNDLFDHYSYYLFKDEAHQRERREMLFASVHPSAVSLMFEVPEWGGMAAEDIDRLADELRGVLETRLGLRVCRGNSPLGGACDDQYAKRDAARRTTVRPDSEAGYAPRTPILQFRARYDPARLDTMRKAMEGLAREHGLRSFTHPPVSLVESERAESERSAPSAGAARGNGAWAGRRSLSERRTGPVMAAVHLSLDGWPHDTRRTVLTLSNDLVATTLDLSAYGDQASFGPARAESLALEAKSVLESRLGLRFCRVNPAKFLCDETYARLEAERVAEAARPEVGGESPKLP